MDPDPKVPSPSQMRSIRAKLYSENPYVFPWEKMAQNSSLTIYSADNLPEDEFTLKFSSGEYEDDKIVTLKGVFKDSTILGLSELKTEYI